VRLLLGSYASRVKRGVAFLDRKVGRDVWLDRVTAYSLDVQSDHWCPLAQSTDTSYWAATREFNLPTEGILALRTARLGFLDAPHDYSDGLTREWRDAILQLRAESESPRPRVTARVG
jgi:hypothetical protein